MEAFAPVDESLLTNVLKKFIGEHVSPVLIELLHLITHAVQID